MGLHTWNVLSLCTGYGGGELGLRVVVPRARTVCVVEREAFLVEHLAQAMEGSLMDEAAVFTDVRAFDGKPWRGKVDCIIGGYPCQPFSIAGRRLWSRDPRHLWPDIARIVDEVQPSYCFFENVDHHLRLGFDEVAKDLDRLGFVVEAGIFSSAETGASHVRERLYIMAYSESSERRQEGEGPGSEYGSRREREEATSGIGERGRSLGDSESVGRTETVSGEAFGERPDASEPELGNSEGERCGEERGLQAKRSGRPGGSCSNVGHYVGAGVWWNRRATLGAEAQGDRQGREDGTLRDATERADGSVRHPEIGISYGLIPFDPPGRNDVDGWRGTLELYPELAPKLPMATQPVIRPLADAIASRVDKVRAVGNGIDPVVFAVAFTTLWHRIHGADE